MTKTSIEDIEKLIQKDVENRTFSMEAIDAIKVMRNEVQVQGDTIARLRKEAEKLQKQIRDQDSQLSKSNANIVKLTAKVTQFSDREKIHIEQDKQLAVAEATKQLAVDMAMGLVRNTTYRSEMFGQGPIEPPTKDQYGNLQYGTSAINENVTKTAE